GPGGCGRRRSSRGRRVRRYSAARPVRGCCVVSWLVQLKCPLRPPGRDPFCAFFLYRLLPYPPGQHDEPFHEGGVFQEARGAFKDIVEKLVSEHLVREGFHLISPRSFACTRLNTSSTAHSPVGHILYVAG